VLFLDNLKILLLLRGSFKTSLIILLVIYAAFLVDHYWFNRQFGDKVIESSSVFLVLRKHKVWHTKEYELLAIHQLNKNLSKFFLLYRNTEWILSYNIRTIFSFLIFERWYIHMHIEEKRWNKNITCRCRYLRNIGSKSSKRIKW